MARGVGGSTQAVAAALKSKAPQWFDEEEAAYMSVVCAFSFLLLGMGPEQNGFFFSFCVGGFCSKFAGFMIVPGTCGFALAMASQRGRWRSNTSRPPTDVLLFLRPPDSLLFRLSKFSMSCVVSEHVGHCSMIFLQAFYTSFGHSIETWY